MIMRARIRIMPKTGVLDPQGKAIEGALGHMGFTGVNEVRQGKIIEMTVDETDPEKAKAAIEAMCRDLLANPVMENFAVELI